MSENGQGDLFGGDLDRLRREAKEDIERCRCCGGKTKLYRRKLNSGMAAASVWLWANHEMEYAHLAQDASRIILRNRDYSKLELWGLIEQQPNADPSKRTSGIWRLTDQGRLFALRRIEVASHVFLRSPGNELEGWENTTTDVMQSLGKHFNYHELMRGDG